MNRMYKVRLSRKGEKPTYHRHPTEAEARRAAATIPGAKYIGPVTLAKDARGEWKEVR